MSSVTPTASKARDRLADLVVHRAKRSASQSLASTLNEAELRQTVVSELSQGRHAADVVTKIARMTPQPTKVDLPPPPRGATQTPNPQPSTPAAGKAPNSEPTPTPARSMTRSRAVESFKELQSPPRFNIAPTPHIPIRAPKQEEDLWGVLAKQQDAELVEIRARAKAIHNEKLRQQKEILDEQCAIRKNRKANERSAHLAERSVVDTQKVRWDNETKEVIEKHRDIALQIKKEREEQVEARKQRREALERERQEMEAAILKRMQDDLAEEKRQQQRLKERQVKFREELITANEEQKKRVEERKIHEAELEAAAHKALIERVEKEERARVEALHQMKEKMKGREAMALALQATIEEKAAEDEARALRVTQARIQAEIAKEQAALEKKKAATEVILEFRAKQLQIHRQQEEEEKQRLLKEKLDAEAEVRESIKVIKARKEKEKAKIIACRQMLEEQMMDNAEFNPVRMSEEEQRINSRLLTRAVTSGLSNHTTPTTSPARAAH
jgi:hypothetical protein